MSFFSNFQSDKCPGSITGNPLNGLNEKVCIQVEKVFDACIKQSHLRGYSLTLTNIQPECPVPPLTFVSARSKSSKGEVSNLNVDRTADKACARVTANVTIPMQVVFTDANGTEVTADGNVVVPVDVLLFVPTPSILPFNVTAVVSAVAPNGTFTSDTEISVDLCTTIILKISMPVELLIPSYGYCAIPPAQEYSQEVCAGFFELPLYPQGRSCSKQ